jgi:cell division protein FtsQ
MSISAPARPSGRTRRVIAGLTLVAAVLAAAYFLWLRDSSLVRVEEVTVTGLRTAEAGDIRKLLDDAARDMTTLNVDEEALEAAAAGYPSVAGIEAEADLPHALAIEVIERRPIAMLEGPDGREVPVAADGTMLPDFGSRDSLALLPATVRSAEGRLEDQAGLTALAAVAASPPALAGRIEAVEGDEEGDLVATLEDGLQVLLGDDSRLDAKWAAVAAAIAEGGAADAGYVDVSLPERPAAGL